MVFALGPVVAKAGLLEETARAVVQERARRPLALRVLWIRLHHSTARLRDQVQRAVQRHGGNAHRGLTVEDQGGVRPAFMHQTLLVVAVTRRALALLGPCRMEPGAPATAPHAVVPLRELNERIPGRGVERPDRILAHGHFRAGRAAVSWRFYRNQSTQRQKGCPAGSRNTRKDVPGWCSCLVAPSSSTATSATSRSSTITSRCICCGTSWSGQCGGV